MGNSIKVSIGKLYLQSADETIETKLDAAGLVLLPISFADTVKVRQLPLHHRDPFDRILIAQAMNHSLVFISQDTQLDAYSIQRLWG